MSTSEQHHAKIIHNRAFTAHLETQSSFHDWVIIGLFYTAVHQIERYLDGQGIHCHSHAQRNGCISQFHDLRSIWPDYQDLLNMSRDARYNTIPWTPDHVAEAKEYLENIENTIESLLA
jgi:hypothetical protein